MQILKKNIQPFIKKTSLAVIYVEYDRQDNQSSNKVFKTLQGYLSKIKGCTITYIKVDNKFENRGIEQATENIYTIGGNNLYREFSGWQKGVENLAAIAPQADVILFANDMFLKPGASFLEDYATSDILNRVINNKEIIGRIDSTGQDYEAYGYNVSSWICTNCFLASSQAVTQLKDIVTIKGNLDDFLPPSFPGALQNTKQPPEASYYFQPNAPINEAYKNWLVEWLTSRWHSSFQPDHTTWDIFRNKVRNILNEALLTARFKELGYHPANYGDKKYY